MEGGGPKYLYIYGYLHVKSRHLALAKQIPFLWNLHRDECVLALYIHQHRQEEIGRIDNLLTSATGGLQTHFGYLTHGVKAVFEPIRFISECAEAK